LFVSLFQALIDYLNRFYEIQSYVEFVDDYTTIADGVSNFASDLGTEEIIDYVNQGIKEFNINISDLTKGTNMLKRFGGFDR
jgi:hypothetical protein